MDNITNSTDSILQSIKDDMQRLERISEVVRRHATEFSKSRVNSSGYTMCSKAYIHLHGCANVREIVALGTDWIKRVDSSDGFNYVGKIGGVEVTIFSAERTPDQPLTLADVPEGVK